MISVVTIFLNAEQFLKEAVESVFGQTFQDWELLLVDDGSTDGSSAFAKDLARKNPDRVQYLEHDHHQNLGMSASRNFGISRAKGPYIALLDADDVWYPNKLEEQYRILEANPQAQMVYGNHQFWKSWTGNAAYADLIMDQKPAADRLFHPPELLQLYLESWKVAISVPSDWLFRKEMALRRKFDNSFRNMYEDQIFIIQVFAHEIVYVSTQTWTRYRQHEESFVAKYQKAELPGNGIPPALKWAEQYLAGQGFQETKPWKTLQKVLFRFRHPFLFRLKQKMKSLAALNR